MTAVAVFLGTSITLGGFPTSCGARLGWTVVNQGVGGTGYLRTTDGLNDFLYRIPTVVAAAPDVVVIEGGVNDVPAYGFSIGQFTTRIAVFYAALRAALPNALFYITAPSAQGRVWADIQANAAALRAIAPAYGAYIDWLSPSWITGTGMVGGLVGDGNADVYVSADGIHPSTAGHAYLGTRLAQTIHPPVTGLDF